MNGLVVDQGQPTETTIYMGMSGDLFEFLISPGGDVETAVKAIMQMRKADAPFPNKCAIRFYTAAPGQR